MYKFPLTCWNEVPQKQQKNILKQFSTPYSTVSYSVTSTVSLTLVNQIQEQFYAAAVCRPKSDCDSHTVSSQGGHCYFPGDFSWYFKPLLTSYFIMKCSVTNLYLKVYLWIFFFELKKIFSLIQIFYTKKNLRTDLVINVSLSINRHGLCIV